MKVAAAAAVAAAAVADRSSKDRINCSCFALPLGG
jgi:hypothetical protein